MADLHKELKNKILHIYSKSQFTYNLLNSKINSNSNFYKYYSNIYKSYLFTPLNNTNYNFKNNNSLNNKENFILNNVINKVNNIINFNYFKQNFKNIDIKNNLNDKKSNNLNTINNNFLNDKETDFLNINKKNDILNADISKNIEKNNKLNTDISNIEKNNKLKAEDDKFKFYPSLKDLLQNIYQYNFFEKLNLHIDKNFLLKFFFLLVYQKINNCDKLLEKHLLEFFQQRKILKINLIDDVIYSEKNIFFLKYIPYKNCQISANYNTPTSQMPKWHTHWDLITCDNKKFENKIKNPFVDSNFNALRKFISQHKKQFNKNFYNFYNICYIDSSVTINFNYQTISNKYPKNNDFIVNNDSVFYNLLNNANKDIDLNKLNIFKNLFKLNYKDIDFEKNNFYINSENIIYDYTEQEINLAWQIFIKYIIDKRSDICQIYSPTSYNQCLKIFKNLEINELYQYNFKKLLNAIYFYPLELIQIYTQKINYLNAFFNFLYHEHFYNFFFENTINQYKIDKINNIFSNDLNTEQLQQLLPYLLNFNENSDLNKISTIFNQYLEDNININPQQILLNLIKGVNGESNILFYLKKLLPSNKFFIYDGIYLPHPTLTNSIIQIDGLIVSPYGIFVLEIKNYSITEIKGNINDKLWQVKYINKNQFTSIHNLHSQNLAHVNHLQTLLGLQQEYFIPMIILNTHCPNNDIIIDNNLKNIVYDIKCVDVIKKYNNEKQILSDFQIFYIKNLLNQLQYLDSDNKIRQLHSNYKNRLYYYQLNFLNLLEQSTIKNIDIPNTNQNYLNIVNYCLLTPPSKFTPVNLNSLINNNLNINYHNYEVNNLENNFLINYSLNDKFLNTNLNNDTLNNKILSNDVINVNFSLNNNINLLNDNKENWDLKENNKEVEGSDKKDVGHYDNNINKILNFLYSKDNNLNNKNNSDVESINVDKNNDFIEFVLNENKNSINQNNDIDNYSNYLNINSNNNLEDNIDNEDVKNHKYTKHKENLNLNNIIDLTTDDYKNNFLNKNIAIILIILLLIILFILILK